MEILRELAAVVVVLSALIALWAATRGKHTGGLRLFQTKKARHLELIETLRLTPHHSLQLIRVNGSSLLVATYANGCRVLQRPSHSRPSE